MLDSLGVPLMQCLAPLLKRVQQGTGGKTVVALFRSIFWYYKHHWDSELEREIYRLVANVLMRLHIDLTIIYVWAKVMGSNPVQPRPEVYVRL